VAADSFSLNSGPGPGVRARLIQLFIKVAVLATLFWVGRRALVRWVNGAERIPSIEPWPPFGEAREVVGPEH
jgi:hypothetical protein